MKDIRVRSVLFYIVISLLAVFIYIDSVGGEPFFKFEIRYIITQIFIWAILIVILSVRFVVALIELLKKENYLLNVIVVLWCMFLFANIYDISYCYFSDIRKFSPNEYQNILDKTVPCKKCNIPASAGKEKNKGK